MILLLPLHEKPFNTRYNRTYNSLIGQCLSLHTQTFLMYGIINCSHNGGSDWMSIFLWQFWSLRDKVLHPTLCVTSLFYVPTSGAVMGFVWCFQSNLWMLTKLFHCKFCLRFSGEWQANLKLWKIIFCTCRNVVLYRVLVCYSIQLLYCTVLQYILLLIFVCQVLNWA